MCPRQQPEISYNKVCALVYSTSRTLLPARKALQQLQSPERQLRKEVLAAACVAIQYYKVAAAHALGQRVFLAAGVRPCKAQPAPRPRREGLCGSAIWSYTMKSSTYRGAAPCSLGGVSLTDLASFNRLVLRWRACFSFSASLLGLNICLCCVQE